MQETKEHIKSRMLNNAARLWGYNETQPENNFDPLVSLLFGACALELEKLSGEIHASRARIMERLVQLLCPDTLTGASPCHAVASALPIEPSAEVHGDMQFYTQINRKVSNDAPGTETNDVFFSPTARFHLNRASIRYMAIGRYLYKVTGTQKEMISTAVANWADSSLWLAIDEPTVSLHRSSFYFDLKGNVDRHQFYHQLPKAKWFCNGEELQHVPGYGEEQECGDAFDWEGLRNGGYSVLKKVQNQVNSYYRRFFVSLTDKNGVTVRPLDKGIHKTILADFPGKRVGDIEEGQFRWLQIKFPEAVPIHSLQDLGCTMNCFPVINRRLHQINYRLKDLINIIPLQSGDCFLDMESVCTEENRPLGIHSMASESHESPVMLLRNGTAGRFDERDAAGMIDYLLQVLRDESAAFFMMDNEFVTTEVKKLQQIMNKLEQRLHDKQVHKSSCPYLMIYNDDKLDAKNLVVKFSSTMGQQASQVKTGTRLISYNSLSFISNQAYLASPPRGGRDKLTATETVLAYKSSLLSKDRLISVEDIKSFCFFQMGKGLKRMEIQAGVMVHPDSRQGYSKTIDVGLYLEEAEYRELESRDELEYWKEYLADLLAQKSMTWMPYRVRININ